MLLKIIAHILYISSPQRFGTRNWFHGRQFFHGPGVGGMLSGWFKHSIFFVHFISNLMLALIWQQLPIQGQSLGTPGCLCSNTLQGRYHPWSCVISLAVSSINPAWLPIGLLLVVFDGRILRHVTCLPEIFMCLHWNTGVCLLSCECLIDIGKIYILWCFICFHLWVIKLFFPQV